MFTTTRLDTSWHTQPRVCVLYVFVADVLCVHKRNSIEVAPTLFLGGGYYDTTTQNPKRRQRE